MTVMVVGGSTSVFEDGNDVEYLMIGYPDNGTAWPKPADLPKTRRGHVGALLDGVPTVCAGVFQTDCLGYSFQENAWLTTLTLPEERGYSSGVQTRHDQLWIAGGEQSEVSRTSIMVTVLD